MEMQSALVGDDQKNKVFVKP